MYINNLNLEKGGPPVTALALIQKNSLSFSSSWEASASTFN